MKDPLAYATSKFGVEKTHSPLHLPLKPDAVFKKQRASKILLHLQDDTTKNTKSIKFLIYKILYIISFYQKMKFKILFLPNTEKFTLQLLQKHRANYCIIIAKFNLAIDTKQNP